MTHSDEILQYLSMARNLYLKAGALIDEAITKATAHTYSEPVADKLREAKHDLASPLSVIFNAHLLLTDRRAKQKQSRQANSPELRQRKPSNVERNPLTK